MLCDRGRAPKFCLLHSLPEVQLQSSIVVARFGSAFSYIHVCGNLVPVCSLICWNVCLMCLEWKLESINYWITYTILHDQFLVSFWFSFWSVIKCYSMTFYWNYDFCLQEQITKINIQSSAYPQIQFPLKSPLLHWCGRTAPQIERKLVWRAVVLVTWGQVKTWVHRYMFYVLGIWI